MITKSAIPRMSEVPDTLGPVVMAMVGTTPEHRGHLSCYGTPAVQSVHPAARIDAGGCGTQDEGQFPRARQTNRCRYGLHIGCCQSVAVLIRAVCVYLDNSTIPGNSCPRDCPRGRLCDGGRCCGCDGSPRCCGWVI